MNEINNHQLTLCGKASISYICDILHRSSRRQREGISDTKLGWSRIAIKLSAYVINRQNSVSY